MIITDVSNHLIIRPKPKEISLSSHSQMPGLSWIHYNLQTAQDGEEAGVQSESLRQEEDDDHLSGRWNISATLSQTLLLNPELCSDIMGEKTLLRQKGKGSDQSLLGPLFKLNQVHMFL